MTDPTLRSAEQLSDASLGELVARVSQHMTTLVRDEMRLAQAEMTTKAKRAGLGAGLFGGAGLFAVYGLACLVAAAVLGLAGPVDDWLAALIVAAVLFVVAALSGLVGKKQISEATPPVPTEAVAGIQQDIQTAKSGGTR